MNPIKIEKGAVEAIKRVIRLHEMMDESLSETDKNPSWDGNIFLYENKDLKVEHMLCKIPAQVKGKNDESLFSKEGITYPVKYKYLRTYSADGGVIYFVVILSDDGEKDIIFYNDLTPNKLQELLKGTKDKEPNQTKNIFLNRLKKNNRNELYDILIQFAYESGRIEEKKYNALYKMPEEYIWYVVVMMRRVIEVCSDYSLGEIINEDIFLQINREIKDIPSPFEIAEFFGIRITFVEMIGVSFFNRSNTTIYISNKYIHNQYCANILAAHELGHFFLDDSSTKPMDNEIKSHDFLIKYKNEYAANIFTVLLMPQLIEGLSLNKLSPFDLDIVIGLAIEHSMDKK